jgi:type VI protein secretion system component VasF
MSGACYPAGIAAPGRGKVTSMARVIALLATSLGIVLAVAPTAVAADGVGLAGRTDDKLITFVCFGVIGFFALLVTVLSLIQIRLDSRKEQRQTELERIGANH